MGIQRRGALAWLPRLLDRYQAAGEAAQPVTENADSSDELAKEGAAYNSWRHLRKRVGPTKAVIVAVVVILVSGARYFMSKRSRPSMQAPQSLAPHLQQTKQLLLDEVSVRKYVDEFNAAADAMKQAWGSSEPPDGQELLGDPLDTISSHVAKMRECKVPPESSVKARRGFVQHVQVLQSICSAVTLRLEELKWYMDMNKDFGMPVPVPGHDQPVSYPSLKELEEMREGGLTANEFLHSLGLFGGGSAQSVDAGLVAKLVWLLDIGSTAHEGNLLARHYLERLVQPLGDDTSRAAHATAARSTTEYQIPYTGRPFGTAAFAQAVARIYGESHGTLNYADERYLRGIVENWTTNRMAL
ncbi:LOW QUALITY PROTEIN: uncharacterized protein EMH_0005190 [Eimeria mitis]|uniref:Uncharacterized protein n=1 Tax=Eimeria mitis TaxID=44415 RepID=U6JZ15_9EIME|nr:LOW QUALITY PROTEIN: uncharacterized protein EMH_0005190 [Eimeria mitis]CDJ29966.1 hypothetical protein EMH_0005190 [Eimeria mitis]